MNRSLATRANREFFFFFEREQRMFFLIIYPTNRIDSLRRIGCIVKIILVPQAYTLILYVLYVKKLCHLSRHRSADIASLFVGSGGRKGETRGSYRAGTGELRRGGTEG